MPRDRRIEYPDAIYHVMARGDRCEDIVVDDAGRQRFEETLQEAIEKTGWILYAWVLMSNHYHLVFRTPQPNFVKGMSWFQNAWTRRFNARHRMWGHLFGGRYKAIPVEEGDYLARLISYVHLNPVRAGLVRKTDGVESYRWCSLADYAKPMTARRGWVAVERGLAELDIPDTAAGRRRFLEWTQDLAGAGKLEAAGIAQGEEVSLQSTLRRGWYYGTEAFREKLVGRLAKARTDLPAESLRKGYSSAQARDHGKQEAERIIALAAAAFGLRGNAWRGLRKGDWRKGLVAGLIRERSLVSNTWVTERLGMGATGAVSRTIREARNLAAQNPGARKAWRNLERNL